MRHCDITDCVRVIMCPGLSKGDEYTVRILVKTRQWNEYSSTCEVYNGVYEECLKVFEAITGKEV